MSGASHETGDHGTGKFKNLAATYDQLRFLRVTAERLADLAGIPAGGTVLDVATGTGWTALAAARITGPSGRVIGVDLSPDMLARAQQKAEDANLTWAEFRPGKAERLDLPDGGFDVVLSSASLFLLPDQGECVREWARVVRTGGRVGFSAFGPGFLQPGRRLWNARLAQHGIAPPPLPLERLERTDECRRLLGEAGLGSIEVRFEQLGYHVGTPRDRWEDIVAGLEGAPWLSLLPELKEKIRTEHLAELAVLTAPEGFWIDVPAIFAFGTRGA